MSWNKRDKRHHHGKRLFSPKWFCLADKEADRAQQPTPASTVFSDRNAHNDTAGRDAAAWRRLI
jgi:hypothetical protein